MILYFFISIFFILILIILIYNITHQVGTNYTNIHSNELYEFSYNQLYEEINRGISTSAEYGYFKYYTSKFLPDNLIKDLKMRGFEITIKKDRTIIEWKN